MSATINPPDAIDGDEDGEWVAVQSRYRRKDYDELKRVAELQSRPMGSQQRHIVLQELYKLAVVGSVGQ